MKRILLAAFAAAIGMVAGTTVAWADGDDVKVNIDIDFSNSIVNGTVAGTVGSMTVPTDTDYPTEVVDGRLMLGMGNSTVSIPEAEWATEADAVTVSFEIALGTPADFEGGDFYAICPEFVRKGTNYDYVMESIVVNYQSSSVVYNAETQSYDYGAPVFDYYSAIGVRLEDFYTGNATPNWNDRSSFTVTYDYTAKTITTTVTNHHTGKTNTYRMKIYESDGLPANSPLKKFTVYTNEQNNAKKGNSVRNMFDNLKITTAKGKGVEPSTCRRRSMPPIPPSTM